MNMCGETMVEKEKIVQFMGEYVQLAEQIKKLENQQHFIRELVRAYMKQSNERRFVAEGNIAMISVFERESVDKQVARKILNPEQYDSIFIKKKQETLKIMSEQTYSNIIKALKKGDSDDSI